MGALIDLAGEQFGLLQVMERLEDRVTASGARQPMWGCVCKCGRRSVEEGRALRARRALSCRRCVRDPSRMLKYGTTYLVYWPELGILKIGRAFRGSRLEMMRQSGGWPILLAENTDESWERVGLRRLRQLFDPAFTGPSGEGPHRADRILVKGRGWSECFFVEPEDLQLAFDESVRVMTREGNDIGYNPPATPAWRRALSGILRARAADRRRGHRDGTPTPGGRFEPDGVGPETDRAATVRGGEPLDGDRSRRAACADAGGRRPVVDVVGGRPGVAVLDATGIPRTTGCTAARGSSVRARGAAVDGAIFIGWRERKKERGRASGRACESARTGKGTSAGGGAGEGGPLGSVGAGLRSSGTCSPAAPCPVGCSAHRLPGSPAGQSHTLWSLRNLRRASSGVAGEREVHRAARDLRGAAGVRREGARR